MLNMLQITQLHTATDIEDRNLKSLRTKSKSCLNLTISAATEDGLNNNNFSFADHHCHTADSEKNTSVPGS